MKSLLPAVLTLTAGLLGTLGSCSQPTTTPTQSTTTTTTTVTSVANLFIYFGSSESRANESNIYSVGEGQVLDIGSVVYPGEATDRTITFTSSLPEAATVEPGALDPGATVQVDDNGSSFIAGTPGLIKGLKVGSSTKITASTAGTSPVTRSFTVKVVTPVLTKDLAITNSGLTLGSDGTAQLKTSYSVLRPTDSRILWTSSAPDIATVSATGLVAGVGPGTATITATAADGSKIAATCPVTVVAAVPVTQMTLSETRASLEIGKNLTLTTKVLPSSATSLAMKWTSSNPAVATVTASGLVVAKGVGTTTIKVSNKATPSVAASCELTVTKVFSTPGGFSASAAGTWGGSYIQIIVNLTESASTMTASGATFDIRQSGSGTQQSINGTSWVSCPYQWNGTAWTAAGGMMVLTKQ